MRVDIEGRTPMQRRQNLLVAMSVDGRGGCRTRHPLRLRQAAYVDVDAVDAREVVVNLDEALAFHEVPISDLM